MVCLASSFNLTGGTWEPKLTESKPRKKEQNKAGFSELTNDKRGLAEDLALNYLCVSNL